MTTEIQLWDARKMDWEDDDYYALIESKIDVEVVEAVVVQDYFGDKTWHRVDAFAKTEDGCRQTLVIQ